MGIIRGCSSAPRDGYGPCTQRLVKALTNCPRVLTAAFSRDHALGRQALDLRLRVAELGEHLGGVLAEGGWDAAQARLGALHTDRRGHALVPILFDDIAAVDGVRAGQSLV